MKLMKLKIIMNLYEKIYSYGLMAAVHEKVMEIRPSIARQTIITHLQSSAPSSPLGRLVHTIALQVINEKNIHQTSKDEKE